MSLWADMTVFAICLVALHLADRAGSFWLGLLLTVAVGVPASYLLAAIDTYLLGSDIILTADGVETTGRIGAKKTPWDGFCQIGACQEDGTPVLVLVRSGGKPMGEKTLPDWFRFRNPGKLIYLPDDKFTRAFVAEYYGPLDFDRNNKNKEDSRWKK